MRKTRLKAEMVRVTRPAGRDAMRMRGLEPPRGFPHTDLNRARLPIPPHPRATATPLCHAFSQSESAAKTFSACVSGFTPRIVFETLPSSSMTKVERLMPMYFLPPKFFSTQTP
jgi:hypothetical protein